MTIIYSYFLIKAECQSTCRGFVRQLRPIKNLAVTNEKLYVVKVTKL